MSFLFHKTTSFVEQTVWFGGFAKLFVHCGEEAVAPIDVVIIYSSFQSR